jgi:hypothetical protein
MTEPAKTNNRTGVPSRGAEDIGADRRLSWSLGVDFPADTLNPTMRPELGEFIQ